MISLRSLSFVALPPALILGACAPAPMASRSATTTMSAAEGDALYLKRYEAQQNARVRGGGLPSYDPLEVVEGAATVTPLPKAETSRIAPEALDAAEAFAAERNSSAFLVWHDNALVRETYFGDADREYLINSKSLAKPLTAIIVGRAIAQGHIQSLDQPVADFITEWRDDPGKSKILIRHLLDMRTGLAAQAQGQGPGDVMNRAYLHPFHDQVIIDDYPLVNEPGSRYEYANANSELVAAVIARATGQRYDRYLTDALLKPLGAAGGTIWINRPGGTPHSGCCVQLPAQTWMRFGLLLLDDGVWQSDRLLPEGYVAAMRTATDENPHAGLGVWVPGPYVKGRGSLHPSMDAGKTLHSEPYADSELFLFDGNSNQVVYIIPSQGLVIVRTGGWSPAEKPWDNSYLPNRIIENIARAPGEAEPVPQARN